MTEPQQAPDNPGEENLHTLTDEDYFAALDEFPGALDENGRPVELFGDVVDARESKARAADAAERGDA